MESAIRVQIPYEAVYFSLRTNALKKGMNPPVLSPAKHKKLGRLSFSSLISQIV